MAGVLARAAAARRVLATAERAVARALTSDYTATARTLATGVGGVLAEAAESLRRHEAIGVVAATARRELLVHADTAAGLVAELSQHAADAGRAYAAQMLGLPVATRGRGDRAPRDLALRDLLRARAGVDAVAVQEALTRGIAAGQTPEQIAGAMNAVLTGTLRNALLIARTEQLAAHREATRQELLAGSASGQWVWVAELDASTCAVCWAMHGTVHPLDEPMASHPGCRCVMADHDPDASLTTGEQSFDELPDGERLAVLGPGKAALYDAGDLALPQLVGVTHSLMWGPGLRERALRDLS